MNEEQWLACTDPRPMLEFLRTTGKHSERKARLFAAACCRQVWWLLADPRSRRAVEVAEQFAEDSVEATMLAEARVSAQEVCESHIAPNQPISRVGLAVMAAYGAAARGFKEAMSQAQESTVLSSISYYSDLAYHGLVRLRHQESVSQAIFLRDIFGPPPFRTIAIAPSLLRWRDGTVRNLAQAAYDERALPAGTLDNARLGVLADALEEAGCSDADILGHLRAPGAVHVRGCWAVDCLLGKG